MMSTRVDVLRVRNGGRGQVEIGDFLRMARRQWGLIAAFVLAGLGAALLITQQTQPVYSSSAALFVSASQNDAREAYQGSLFSEERVASYAELAVREELSRRVIDRLGLDISPRELSERVSASVQPGTVVLEITVRASTPASARRLTQAVAAQLSLFVEELETTAGSRVAPIKATIVEEATLRTEPVSPRPVLNLGIGGVVGLLSGLGIAFIRDQLDRSIHTDEDVRVVTKAAIIGHIPIDPAVNKEGPTSAQLGSSRLEAFRVLRTNLRFLDVDRECNVFVVTSSVPKEGKTTTAATLAMTIAEAGQKVLLLEGDLRRPRMGQLLGLEPTVGLTTVLVGQVEIRDAIQEYRTVANLSVMTGGAIPPNPSEMLQSHAMGDVIAMMRKTYDVVIVDAPPLLPVTDGALLATLADGALIVVRHGKTTKEELRRSVERLQAVGGRAVGVVLNMVPRRSGTHSYYGDD